MMQSPRTHSAGFTLMETLIVVGLVALLALGIAGVFDTVGDTIDRGKRVSELNRTAAQIERIMRRDFEQMTREAPLIIRNEYANEGQDVSLFDPARFEGEPNERPRRIDEIVFFAHSEHGEFQTARRAMHPDLIATSDSARIYYGHGRRQVRPLYQVANATARNDPYYHPRLEDPNYDPDSAFGVPSSQPGLTNPNQYASDWGLLRHVLLLSSPNKAETTIPQAMIDIVGNRALLEDNRVQVAMQPAVQSAFRKISRYVPRVPGMFGQPTGYRLDSRQTPPWLSSGLVDIAVTDFGEIRSIVHHMTIDPADFQPRNGPPFESFFDPLVVADRRRMQLWMLELLPGNAREEIPGNALRRTRMRFEYEPPLLAIMDQDLASGSAEFRELERAYRQIDQEMLTSSVFVPACTEFIVEWSYGLIDDVPGSPTFGQLVWYGLPRYEDINGNGQYDVGTDVIVAQPFTGVPAEDVLPRLTGRPASEYAGNFYPTRDLINMGLPPAPLQPDGQTEVSLFGYFDPGPLTPNGDPDDSSWQNDPFTTDPPVDNPADDRPWLWPTMIRITMTIADRTDPTVEQTYQVVFDVPNGGLDNE